jgi:hypothetical protein
VISSDGHAVYVHGDIDQPVAVPDVPCPQCSNTTLRVENRMTVIGLAPVAGVQIKASAVNAPWLVCSSCDFTKRGKR